MAATALRGPGTTGQLWHHDVPGNKRLGKAATGFQNFAKRITVPGEIIVLADYGVVY